MSKTDDKKPKAPAAPARPPIPIPRITAIPPTIPAPIAWNVDPTFVEGAHPDVTATDANVDELAMHGDMTLDEGINDAADAEAGDSTKVDIAAGDSTKVDIATDDATRVDARRAPDDRGDP